LFKIVFSILRLKKPRTAFRRAQGTLKKEAQLINMARLVLALLALTAVNSQCTMNNNCAGAIRLDQSGKIGTFGEGWTGRGYLGGSSSGRIEVLLNGVWGTVCDDGFTDQGAMVACKAMGFTMGGVMATHATWGAPC
jgi:hypothetical protein